jgi:hypothetical protein
MDIKWNQPTLQTFHKVLDHLPQFHKSIAQQLVKERSEELAKERGSEFVEDKDLITAFFQEVPPAFREMMKRRFVYLNIDYSEYVKDEEPSTESKT